MQPALLSSPILDIDATFLVYLGVFALLFLVLRAYVFGPAMALFDARDEAIEGAKRKARRLEVEAQEKLTAFEKELDKVRQEAAAEREKLRAESQKKERALLADVTRETDAMLAEARAEMDREAAAARAAIEGETSQIASQIADKLLARRADA